MAKILPEKNLDTNLLLYMGNSQPSSVYYGDNEIYKIYFGSTLVYEKSVPEGETWVLNESPNAPSANIDVNIDFKSNNENFKSIYIPRLPQWARDGITYYKTDSNAVIAFDSNTSSWISDAYRTITFEEAVTDSKLLTWLQANGTKQGGSSVSKNWKFNGTPAFMPQMTLSNHVTISGEAYNDTTFVEDFKYIYYADDWSCIAFGSAGFWDISKNQYGKNAGNILKFNTEPSGELLAFLQAHAQPI